MKNFLRILPFVICAVSGIAVADDFRSEVITGTGSLGPIRVHGDQFMVIRNFTQEDSASTSRGVVTITKLPNMEMAKVLSAAIISQSTSPPFEVINNVVIAGPADVLVTCGASMGSNCFITFRKESN